MTIINAHGSIGELNRLNHFLIFNRWYDVTFESERFERVRIYAKTADGVWFDHPGNKIFLPWDYLLECWPEVSREIITAGK